MTRHCVSPCRQPEMTFMGVEDPEASPGLGEGLGVTARAWRGSLPSVLIEVVAL